ncbi:GGDEF domain-containing protein [Thaumasiovibrio subtropicus]|uniref:GGDEF domain-containing protein n=1 Tax=Thaumasiovibrio subtropicus TaxID=1891207 RepID=UPI000B35A9F2|nr:GGDEF domain-containing protein [Thaumasiovibrio subtropicus]
MRSLVTAYHNVAGFITGSENDVLVRIHHAFMAIVVLFLLVAAVFNQVLSVTPTIYNFVLVVAASGVVTMWYLSRFKGYFRSMTVAFAIFLLGFAIPLSWIMNAGSYGPTGLYCLTTAVYTLSVLRDLGVLRWSFTLVALFVPSIMLAIEHTFPQLVVPYTDNSVRFWDLQFSYVAAVVLLLMMVKGHIHRFREETMLARNQAGHLKRLAEIDGLTGIANHRKIMELAHLYAEDNAAFSLILADVDHFKRLNDREGHLVGDKALMQVASVLESHCVSYAYPVGRYGGEEFLIVCRGSTQLAAALAEELRVLISQVEIANDALTMSFGVAGRDGQQSVSDVLNAADEALYAAKAAGRNRISVAPSLQLEAV